MFNTCTSKLFISTILLTFGLNQTLHAQMNVQFQDTLNQTIASFASSNSMQGVATAVVFPDGSTWSSTEGNHGLQPLNTNMLFDIGSNTKSMVSTLILMLEEENQLSIDDTLYQYIDPIEHVPFGITLKQLLSHRSGITSYTDHANFSSEINTNDTYFWHPDSILAHFVTTPNFTAGTQFEYSNTNYLLLGKVIESIENQPLHTILSDRLFTPYQLDHMYMDQYDSYSLIKTGAWFGTSNYDDFNFISFMSSAWAAGGVVSTPDDFASYCYQLCRGDILSSISMDKMTTGTNTNIGEYGLGLIKDTYHGKPYLKHGGTTLQNSEMHYSIDTDFSVVTMNIDYGFYSETADLQETLIDLLEDLIPEFLTTDEINYPTSVAVYPNPSNDQIHISCSTIDSNQKTWIEVYNTKGQPVLKQQITSNTITLNKNEIGTGVYYAKVFTSHSIISQQKIVFY